MRFTLQLNSVVGLPSTTLKAGREHHMYRCQPFSPVASQVLYTGLDFFCSGGLVFPLCPRVLLPASVCVSAHGCRECNTLRLTLVSVVTWFYPSSPPCGRPSRSIVREDTRNLLKMLLFSEIPPTEGIQPGRNKKCKA